MGVRVMGGELWGVGHCGTSAQLWRGNSAIGRRCELKHRGFSAMTRGFIEQEGIANACTPMTLV
jgi:hypothetical protein